MECGIERDDPAISYRIDRSYVLLFDGIYRKLIQVPSLQKLTVFKIN